MLEKHRVSRGSAPSACKPEASWIHCRISTRTVNSVHHDIAETLPCRILLFVRANSLVSEFDVLKQGTSALKLRAVAGETWSLEDTGTLIPALKLLAPISLAHHLQSHPSGNPSTWFPFITNACRCFCIRLQFGGMIAKTCRIHARVTGSSSLTTNTSKNSAWNPDPNQA